MCYAHKLLSFVHKIKKISAFETLFKMHCNTSLLVTVCFYQIISQRTEKLLYSSVVGKINQKYFHMNIIRAYHQPQHKAADSLSNLRRYVVAKLLQRGQETFQLAQLASPTGGWQLLVRQRRGRGRGRSVAVTLWRRWHCIQGRWGMMIPVGHWGEMIKLTKLRCAET